MLKYDVSLEIRGVSPVISVLSSWGGDDGHWNPVLGLCWPEGTEGRLGGPSRTRWG